MPDKLNPSRIEFQDTESRLKELREKILSKRTLVVNFCRRLIGDNLSEDMANETMLAAINKAGQFRGEGTLLSWLYRIAQNICYHHMEKEKKNPVKFKEQLFEDSAETVPDLSPNPEESLIDEEKSLLDDQRKDLLYKMMERLHGREKEIITLNLVEELKPIEIARLLKVTEASVKSALYHARKKLAKYMGGVEDFSMWDSKKKSSSKKQEE